MNSCFIGHFAELQLTPFSYKGTSMLLFFIIVDPYHSNEADRDNYVLKSKKHLYGFLVYI